MLESVLGNLDEIEASWRDYCSINSSKFCLFILKNSILFKINFPDFGFEWKSKPKLIKIGYFRNKLFDCPLAQILWARYKGQGLNSLVDQSEFSILIFGQS